MENKFIKELKETKVLQEEGYTFKDYISQLKEFQRLIVNAIYQEDIPLDEVRIDEAISELGKLCRKNNIDPDVASKVKGTLKSINKELAINMSGLNAENYVIEKIALATRDKKVNFQNVYVTDGKHETEIDDVVLTDEGIIIFEVKSVKKNVIIDKHGRLLRDKHICYDKLPITQNMEIKRNMLGNKIVEMLSEKNQEIPNLYIESYIAFVTPKDKVIEVTDESGLEAYCFKEDITNIINGHINSGFKYSDDEFKTLINIISELGSDMQIKENKIDSQTIIDLTVSLLEQIYPEKEYQEEIKQGKIKVKKSKFNLFETIGKSVYAAFVINGLFDLTYSLGKTIFQKINYKNQGGY